MKIQNPKFKIQNKFKNQMTQFPKPKFQTFEFGIFGFVLDFGLCALDF